MPTKNLVLKLARFNKDVGDSTLQSLLQEALKKKSAAKLRSMVGNDDSQYMLINYNTINKAMMVGEFIDYTLGHKQPFAKLDPKATSFPIDTLKAVEGTNFLHSIMYFGVWNNTVVLAQSSSLKSLHFEAYLNWIIHESGLLEEGNFVSLCDSPPVGKKFDVSSAKSIEFHAPIDLLPEKMEQSLDGSEAKAITFKPSNIGWEVLQHLLPDAFKLPKELKTEDVATNQELEVTVRLAWTRVAKTDSTKFMDALSNQLRHVDSELDYTIHTKSGTITKDELKLKTTVSVKSNIDGLISRVHMWDKLHEWLQQLLKEKRIPVDS